MPSRQKIRFCTASDGVRLAYSSSGEGPALVKASNWLTHLESDAESPIWHHWVEALSRRHAYIRYDARGCGLSDRYPPDISLEAWVRDLASVVDALELERFALLGISQGGAIAASYAARHPERVSHLVLYGAFARGRLNRDERDKRIEESLLYYKLARAGWGEDHEEFRQVFAMQMLPDATTEQLRAFDDLQRLTSNVDDALRYMQASDQIDVTAIAPRVRCPTLVMHARHDRRVPFEEGRLFASLVPGARFVPLDSRNHVLMDHEPAFRRFVEEVEAFLPHGGGGAFTALTVRERELLELVARGLDNHQIAAHLALSEKTVRNHVSAILAKLGADSRARAVVLAREAGFGAG